jgi:hypothetical protein
MHRIIEHNGKKYLHIQTKLSIFRPGKAKIEIPIVIQADISGVSSENLMVSYKSVSGIFDKPYIVTPNKQEKKTWLQRMKDYFGSK